MRAGGLQAVSGCDAGSVKQSSRVVFIVGFAYYFRSHLGHQLLRYNTYCISIANTNQAQLMIVYKASNVCILLTFVSAII